MLQGRDKTKCQTRNKNIKKEFTKEERRRNGQVKKLEGLNMFDGTNLTFISDVDQEIPMEYLLVHTNQEKTRKDMALSAISMNSALADKEFVLSLHHKLHVSTCINKPNDVHKHNQSIIHSINQSFLHKQQ